MKPDWTIDLSICTAGCIVERIGQNPQDESLFRRLTDGNVPGTVGEVRAVRRSQSETARRGKTETFTFLGFTHFCGQRIRDGAFIVWRITAKKRMVAKLKAIKAELQRRKHDRTATVGAWLRTVVLGYYQYHAVPGNTTQLRIFQRRVNWLWRSVLIRRSQRAQVRWERLTPPLKRWVPQPRVLHPYPDARFYATHPS
jgi:RNA-directed DNA polymerase